MNYKRTILHVINLQRRTRFVFSFLACFLLCLPALSANAQNNARITSRSTPTLVIFDPVLIEVSTTEASATDDSVTDTPGAGEAAPEEIPSVTSVTELTPRPESGDGKVAAFAPPDTIPDEEQLALYQQAVTAFEVEEGAYGPELSEALFSLGNVFRQRGDYESALENYDRALHLNRIQYGLFSEFQTDIILTMVDTYIDMGELEEAQSRQEYLYYLKQKLSEDDVDAMVQASIEFADWNYNIAQYAYQSSISGSYEFLLKRTIDANNYYSQAADAVSASDNSNPLIEQLEIKRAQSNYYLEWFLSLLNSSALAARNGMVNYQMSESFRQSPYSFELNRAGYKAGESALESRLAYIQAQDDSDPELVLRAMMDIADWYLVFQRRSTAQKMYGEAYTFLEESSLENKEGLRTELFEPALPRNIPAYIARNNSRQAYGISADLPLDEQGYVDLSIEVNRYGVPVKVDVLHRSAGVNENLERILRRDVAASAFRPHYVNGDVTPGEHYTVRYYVSLVY